MTELEAILDEIIARTTGEGGDLRTDDMVWSRWESIDEMRNDLQDHCRRLAEGDRSELFELQVLFAPTGSLQEVSISNGWGEESLELASRFDDAAERLGRTPPN